MNYIPSQTFSDSAHQAEIWVMELSEYLHCERRQAYDCLRSVLHALRDSIGQKAMADFSSHLPPLVRGIFYENWQPEHVRPCSGRLEFIANVQKRSGMTTGIDSEQAARNVFKLLDHRLNPPVIREIKRAMGSSLEPLWPAREEATASAQLAP